MGNPRESGLLECHMSLLDYEKRFSALRLNSSGGFNSPHKVALLLALMDLIDRGDLRENIIRFDNVLKDAFANRLASFGDSSARNNPHLPFFHLRSEGFWHHKIVPGQLESYEQLSTASSVGVVISHIEYAFLDDELFELLQSKLIRNLLSESLLTNLDRGSILDILRGDSSAWDWLECEFLVNDYMVMLEKHLKGWKYSKADHRRELMVRLNNRSKGSIEYKHQNVSTVLIELGLPYIPGYKPAFNYQKQLKQVVLSYFAGHQSILDDVNSFGESDVTEGIPAELSWNEVYDPNPPEHVTRVSEKKPQYIAKRVDYTEREFRNRQLGLKAEQFVLNLERERLIEAGRPDLAREVEWSSQKRGDGVGFDIRSFDVEQDSERFVEVKATSSGKYQPFYISENERAFSNDFSDAYSIYRVYEFRETPRIFILSGSVEQHVQLFPNNYRAEF
ncbi:DUF3883 domain-containing protein [Marinobacter profundi]|uniref:Uncharacterized protein n=1 Tax=Marinobacter profundi TaxID=2666256 RepID=A0A2G1UJX2_9GAMM|nr:DUF3883 domain-containing protein [Marinobacter profundi]PHQ14745.1 hypothetical protein CLH61_10315 [Marinobacter profundi]